MTSEIKIDRFIIFNIVYTVYTIISLIFSFITFLTVMFVFLHKLWKKPLIHTLCTYSGPVYSFWKFALRKTGVLLSACNLNVPRANYPWHTALGLWTPLFHSLPVSNLDLYHDLWHIHVLGEAVTFVTLVSLGKSFQVMY